MKLLVQINIFLAFLLCVTGCGAVESTSVKVADIGEIIIKIADQDSYVLTIDSTDSQANKNVVQTWTDNEFHYSVWEQESLPQPQSKGVDYHHYEMMKWNKDQKVFVSASTYNNLGEIENIDYDAQQYGFPSSRAIFMELLTPGIGENEHGLYLEDGYQLEKKGEDTIVLKSDDKNGLKATIELKDGKIAKIESTYDGTTKTATVTVPDTASKAYKEKVEDILNTDDLEANDPLDGSLKRYG